MQLIRHAQCMEFREEWAALSRGRPVASSSKLLGLQPKLDDDGLMRSDAKHAKFLTFDVRYPVILPRKSWITKLIVKDFHEQGTTHQAQTKHWQRYQLGTGLCLDAKLYMNGRSSVQNVDEEEPKHVSKSWPHYPYPA